MKKGLIFILLSAAIMAAGLKDGSYWVEERGYSHGWKAFTSITVENGEVVTVTYDKFNADNEYASSNDKYNTDMKEKSGSSPAEFTRALEKDFMAKKNVEDIDAIAGATGSVEVFKKQMKFLLKKAKKGKEGKFRLR